MRMMPDAEPSSEDQDGQSEKMDSINELKPLVKACFVCLEEKDLTLCPDCKLIYYCSQLHREIHRPHSTCFPFIVRSADDLGRYMIAARDIDPLELILWEEPAVVGPYSKSGSGCLQCLKRVNGSYSCSGCQFPMCNKDCESSTLHKDECQFFQEKDLQLKRRFSELESKGDSNGCERSSPPTRFPLVSNGSSGPGLATSPLWITPLRMLLKKRTDAKMFNRISMLRDHTSPKEVTSHNSSELRTVSLQVLNVVLLLQEACAGVEEFSQQEIQRMIGILKTNGMKLEPHGVEKGVPGVALYPIYCLLNHSCYSNTNYVKFPDYHLELRSQVPIKRGEQIFTRYISATIGNMRRRDDIKRFWFFDCKCRRCSDSTELGSYMSAVVCFVCRVGYILPKDPLEYKSDWKCDSCRNIVPYDLVDEVISTIESQVGVIENGEIQHLEEMIFHFSQLLHPNHYILIDIMHNLVHLYAAKKVLTRPEKERKVQLCVLVLETLVKIDPGYTKWRGTLLQEMIHTVMLISKEDHAKKRITTKQFHQRLSMCAQNLEEAKKCLFDGFTSQNHETRKYREQKRTRNLN